MINITMYPVKAKKGQTHSQIINQAEIKGAMPVFHVIAAGDSLKIPGNGDVYHILTMIEGIAKYETDRIVDRFEERVTYCPDPNKNLTIYAETDVQILEIKWQVADGDAAELAEFKTVLPYKQIYRTAKQYRDRNKSEKTISRVMLEQRNIPRFAMGSVETYGPDFILAHDHPMLDQYFFSFPENDAFITIEDEPYRMRGNELLYIPLGSKHGVDVVQQKHCHYMWIDFMVDGTAMHRLDTSHLATGTYRSFTSDGKEADK